MTDHRSASVLVVAEPIEDTRDALTSELIAIAQRVGSDIVLLILGEDAKTRSDTFSQLDRVSLVLYATGPELAPSVYKPWLDAVHQAISSVGPSLVLIPATLAGRDIAPRLAARTDVAIASDVIGLSLNSDNAITCKRQVNSGRLVSEITLSGKCPIVTVRPGSDRGVPDDGSSAEVRELQLESGNSGFVRPLETVISAKSQSGLSTAARIVSGGRGLGKPENFHLVEELASALDAAVGASGAVVGAGWRPHSEQVGSTGTTVAPRLYFSVGISGAVQHTIGMSGADSIVAINRDPDAPIFQIASLGVVGDLFEIVPALIEELKNS